MGINGLLPILKSISKEVHLKEFKGKRIAIDGYVWLHRGAYACSQEICLEKSSTKYIKYFMDKISMLLSFGIIPYVVFDGGYLPAKSEKENERKKLREKYKTEGKEYLNLGKIEQARQSFIKAVDITPKMAYNVIKKLKEINVSYIVAPFEADAQLAFLFKEKLVDAVISEDSDCLVYGCYNVLFKLDNQGKAEYISLMDLEKVKGLSFQSFTNEMFMEMCILAGCDYLPSINGLGIKTAHLLMKKYRNYNKIIKMVQLDGKLKVPMDYNKNFEIAKMTFLYHTVFDSRKNLLVPLNPMDNHVYSMDLSFLGFHIYTLKEAKEIAEGILDPIHKKRFIESNDVKFNHSTNNNQLSSNSLNESNIKVNKENNNKINQNSELNEDTISIQSNYYVNKKNDIIDNNRNIKETNAFTRLMEGRIYKRARSASKSPKINNNKVIYSPYFNKNKNKMSDSKNSDKKNTENEKDLIDTQINNEENCINESNKINGKIVYRNNDTNNKTNILETEKFEINQNNIDISSKIDTPIPIVTKLNLKNNIFHRFIYKKVIDDDDE